MIECKEDRNVLFLLQLFELNYKTTLFLAVWHFYHDSQPHSDSTLAKVVILKATGSAH